MSFGKSKGNIWLWNKKVKKAISRKSDAHKAMCRSSVENKDRYKSMKYKAKKVVSKAVRERLKGGLLN